MKKLIIAILIMGASYSTQSNAMFTRNMHKLSHVIAKNIPTAKTFAKGALFGGIVGGYLTSKIYRSKNMTITTHPDGTKNYYYSNVKK